MDPFRRASKYFFGELHVDQYLFYFSILGKFKEIYQCVVRLEWMYKKIMYKKLTVTADSQLNNTMTNRTTIVVILQNNHPSNNCFPLK